jgi:hypothetical protein
MTKKSNNKSLVRRNTFVLPPFSKTQRALQNKAMGFTQAAIMVKITVVA